MVFPFEITITNTNGATLRAGYSANANIIIERASGIVTLPERVITLRDGMAYVETAGSQPGERKEKEVQLGLSDAITVEIEIGRASCRERVESSGVAVAVKEEGTEGRETESRV